MCIIGIICLALKQKLLLQYRFLFLTPLYFISQSKHFIIIKLLVGAVQSNAIHHLCNSSKFITKM